jgi:hypothetical protein
MWRHSKSSSGAEDSLLAPGDKVIYQPVSPREYEHLVAKAAAGELDLEPEQEISAFEAGAAA